MCIAIFTYYNKYQYQIVNMATYTQINSHTIVLINLVLPTPLTSSSSHLQINHNCVIGKLQTGKKKTRNMGHKVENKNHKIVAKSV